MHVDTADRRAITSSDIARLFAKEDTERLVLAAAIPNQIDRLRAIDEVVAYLRRKYPRLFVTWA